MTILTDFLKKWGATMAEYIEREAAIKALKDNVTEMERHIYFGSNLGVPEDEIEDIVNEIPVADVEPVKHAAFVRDEEHWYICGNCHHATCSEFDLEGEYQKIEIGGKVETIYALKQPNYCKHCGSKMDGKEVQE